jgi:hypothetical protein
MIKSFSKQIRFAPESKYNPMMDFIANFSIPGSGFFWYVFPTIKFRIDKIVDSNRLLIHLAFINMSVLINFWITDVSNKNDDIDS